MNGKVYLVGLGPGPKEYITQDAVDAVGKCDVFITPDDARPVIESLVPDKYIITRKMSPVDRSLLAVSYAEQGTNVCIPSIGHPGFYAIASTFFDVLGDKKLDVEVIPGMTSLDYAAARLGSPLGRDYAVVSLADQASPWEEINERAEKALSADLVLTIYNPIGKIGDERLHKIIDYANGIHKCVVGLLISTAVGEEKIIVTDTESFPYDEVTRYTIVIIGNSYTENKNGRMITPRPYLSGKGY